MKIYYITNEVTKEIKLVPDFQKLKHLKLLLVTSLPPSFLDPTVFRNVRPDWNIIDLNSFDNVMRTYLPNTSFGKRHLPNISIPTNDLLTVVLLVCVWGMVYSTFVYYNDVKRKKQDKEYEKTAQYYKLLNEFSKETFNRQKLNLKSFDTEDKDLKSNTVYSQEQIKKMF